VALTVQGLVGLASNDIDLASPDGKWKMSVPAALFSGVEAEPGKMLLVSLTLTRVEVSVDDDQPMLAPKLIIPGRMDS
jgi:hypothetical protein